MARESKSSPHAPAKSRWYWAFVALFVALFSLIFFSRPAVLQSLRLLAFDAYQHLAPAKPLPQTPIRVVDIDEASLAHLGQWPWPRSVMAELTQKLGDAGVSAIGFDIQFSEPDRTSPEQMLVWTPQQRRGALSRVIADWPTHDGELATALANNPSVLAVTLQNEHDDQSYSSKAGLVTAGDDPAPWLPNFSGVSGNLPALTEAAHGVGFINWLPDNDQVVRRVPLLARQKDTVVPSLALEALRVALGGSTYMVRSSNAHGATAFGSHTGVNAIKLGPIVIPTDATGSLWIHFRRYDPNNDISAWRVLSGDINPADLRGTIVLIGASAPGLMDLRATPLDSALPGVEIHRQELEQILSGHFLTRPDFAPGVEWLTALISVLLLAVIARRTPASVAAGIGLVTVALICTAGVVLFVQYNYLFDPVFPSACAFVFSASSATYLYRTAEHQRTEIRRAFSQYVAPSIVRELAAHPERLKLGGEVRDLTVLMCDIRNFTSIAERLNAEELTAFVNSFLSPLTDIIIDNEGTIDKYMGDAILAFWNAPADDAEHARHACEASQRIIARMRELNDQWRAEAQAAGRPFDDVRIGIGLNSGPCCVGNLGSDRRFDYSAIGDTVNISSRLEGLTKAHKLALLVGEETANRAPGLPFLEVDLVRLKGRSAPSRVFTLLADAAPQTFNAEHAAFLDAYRRAQWSDANARLAQVRAHAPDALAALYSVYENRLARLQATAPENWDGVYELEEK